MARVTRVGKSLKEHNCQRGHVIPKGDPYQHATPGFRGRKIIRCMAHPFAPSDLTTSLAAEPMAAAEAFIDWLDSADDSDDNVLEELEAELETLRTAAEEYQAMRQEALDAWENGNSQLEEYVEAADNAASEIDSFDVGETSRESFEDADEWTEHVEERLTEARDMAESLDFQA